MSSNQEVPYWILISVLFSSFPMDQELAAALHAVAMGLYSTDTKTGAVDHRLARGTVVNQNTEAVIGTVRGPVFEAKLDTERGAGLVRFILTREGLDLMNAKAVPRPQFLN